MTLINFRDDVTKAPGHGIEFSLNRLPKLQAVRSTGECGESETRTDLLRKRHWEAAESRGGGGKALLGGAKMGDEEHAVKKIDARIEVRSCMRLRVALLLQAHFE